MSFKVLFPDINTSFTVPEIIVQQQEYHHELIHFSLLTSDITSDKYRTGTRVIVNWASETFYGYINHIENAKVLGPIGTSFVCVGASWVMKEKLQKTFHNTTVTQVVRDIAATYGFSVNIVDHPTVWSVLTQNGVSTWEFLGILAKKIGYTLTAKNTEITFIPRVGDIKELRRIQAPIFNDNNIVEFNVMAGDASSSSSAVMVQGIDPRTNAPIFSGHQGQFDNILGALGGAPQIVNYSTEVVHNMSTAETKAGGHAEGNRFHIRANARLVDLTSLRASDYIFINSNSAKDNGHWFVESVEHVLNNKEEMNVSLLKDSESSANDIPPRDGRVIIADKNSPTGRRKRLPVPTISVIVPPNLNNIRKTRTPVSPKRGTTVARNALNSGSPTVPANSGHANYQWRAAWTGDATYVVDTPKPGYVLARQAILRG